MRTIIQPQLNFSETDIVAIIIDPKSRDDIPPLLCGPQLIFVDISLPQRVFVNLELVMPGRADGKVQVSHQTGRLDMEQRKILGLGLLRLGLNADYDRTQELANQHKTIRQMLGIATDGTITAMNSTLFRTLSVCSRFKIWLASTGKWCARITRR